MYRHLLGAYILVGFWNVGGISSVSQTSRKHRFSDLRSPELANCTTFKFSIKTQLKKMLKDTFLGNARTKLMG